MWQAKVALIDVLDTGVVHSSVAGVTLKISCFITAKFPKFETRRSRNNIHNLSNPLSGKNHFRRASLYRTLTIIPLVTQFARHILLMSGIPSKSVDFQPSQLPYLCCSVA